MPLHAVPDATTHTAAATRAAAEGSEEQLETISTDAPICMTVLNLPQRVGGKSRTGVVRIATAATVRIKTSRPTTSQPSHAGTSPATPNATYSETRRNLSAMG